ncbi:PQ-loop repeat-containing protein 3 isoform X3 [Octodon degus]|uniref:PQ-loop repeat-containing protein 3 isoform X3 n=1 Tax=Octodon degus TaxID=10160 RepID=A0A6P6DDV6_OCTDE|nr:PQ-loop repeat-containing protein 3 isoform X3 [Octodon degus]
MSAWAVRSHGWGRGRCAGRRKASALATLCLLAMEAALLWFCNWSTLTVCAALKLPQIHAQLAARSARGVSLSSLLLELAGFLVCLRYQYYYGSPVLTYLEYPILIVQDVVLLLCVFHFNGDMKQAAPYLAVFAASWFVLGLHQGVIDVAMQE